MGLGCGGVGFGGVGFGGVGFDGVRCGGVGCGMRCSTMRSCAFPCSVLPYRVVFSRDQAAYRSFCTNSLRSLLTFLGRNPYAGMTGEDVFKFVASGQRMSRTSAMSLELYVYIIARYLYLKW